MSVQSVPGIAPSATSRVGTWAAIGFLLYVAIGFLSLLLAAVAEGLVFGSLGIEVAAGTVGLSLRNGLYHVVWTLLAAAVAVPIGRRLVPAARFRGLPGLALLAVGAGLAGLTEILINEWARERFEYFDPEYVGLAGFAPPATVAIAIAAWAALSVPRGSRSILLAVLGAAVVGFGTAVLPSIAGLGDGIDPSSVPLAIVLLADGVVALVAVVIARGSTSEVSAADS